MSVLDMDCYRLQTRRALLQDIIVILAICKITNFMVPDDNEF